MMKFNQLLSGFSIKGNHNKIIYPDIDDERTFEAITILLKSDQKPIICGKKHELIEYQHLIDAGLEYYEVPDDEPNEIFASKILQEGKVDGFVGGNISSTTCIVRALIKNIGSKGNISRISSHFIMGRGEEMFLYSDGGIQIDPNSEQLAEIGYLTILSALKYGMQPRVALLSFSTAGSGGDHEKVLKVRQATHILKQRLDSEGMSSIPVEGEIQFDAAFLPEIGHKKNPKTTLHEPANVFIFPDLDSANIAYKITQRLGNFTALGPILQGLKKPANDLSRGCSVEDIIAMHHITKNG